MKGLKFVAILLAVVLIGVAVCACAPAVTPTPPPTTPPPTTPPPTTPPPTTPPPTTPPPTTPPPTTPPTGLTTYTGTDVEKRHFSVGYPAGWTSDDAQRAAKQEYYKSVSVAGYTLAGACLMFYRSPGKDAYLMVTSVDSPMPIKVDTVLASTPKESLEERFPGYKEVSHEIIDGQKLNAVVIFTCTEGKAKQLQSVKVTPPQVWAVTCMATEEAYAGYEATFDQIIASFKMLES